MRLAGWLWAGLIGVGVVLFIVRPWAEPDPAAPPPAHPVSEAEALYEEAIGDLETALEAQEAPEGLGAALATEREALDVAIAENRRRAAADPSDEDAQETLLENLQRKLELFHNTLMLLRDMERGDGGGARDRIDALSGREPPDTD